MNVALVMAACLAVLALGYFVYGRLVSRLLGVDPSNPTPAARLNDGVDYVPSKPFVVFGHHYASIAAAGPIVGPIIALEFGWLPAILWMVIGVIFVGAVHDFASLFVAMREGGKSVGEVARSTLGTGGFLLFVLFAVILCILVAAVFLELTAKALTSHYPTKELSLEADQTLLATRPAIGTLGLADAAALEKRLEEAKAAGVTEESLAKLRDFRERAAAAKGDDDALERLTQEARDEAERDPDFAGALHETSLSEGRVGGIASTSVIVITIFAPLLGFLLYRRNLNTVVASTICLIVCAVSVVVGFWIPLHLNPQLWMSIVLVYCVVAGFVPVWIVLQPRDFTNAHLLYIGLVVMVVGILLSGALQGATLDEMPMTNLAKAQENPKLGFIWPVLFITIACGAVSGFHGIVSGGTTCKQVASERHAQPIAYGAMVMETVLGVCVVLCVCVGLGYTVYHRQMWEGGAGAPITFAAGVGGTLAKGFGLPAVYGTVFGILLLEGFLVTTTDTVIRLARYLAEEFWKVAFTDVPRLLRSRLFNTVLVAGLAGALAFTSGYALVWPIFGSGNQLLAALTLIVVTAWLIKKGRRFWFTLLPAIFMTVTAMVALVIFLEKNLVPGKYHLAVTAAIVLALAAAFVALTGKMLLKRRRPDAT